jgi:hypothetical protein
MSIPLLVQFAQTLTKKPHFLRLWTRLPARFNPTALSFGNKKRRNPNHATSMTMILALTSMLVERYGTDNPE